MKKMRIFKIGLKDVGKIINVRFLPNIDDLSDHIISIHVATIPISGMQHDENGDYFQSFKKVFRHYSYAYVDGEYCVFEYSHTIQRYLMKEMKRMNTAFFDLKNDFSLKISVSLKEVDAGKFFSLEISSHHDLSNIVWNGDDGLKESIANRMKQKDAKMKDLVNRLYRNRTPINEMSEFFEK